MHVIVGHSVCFCGFDVRKTNLALKNYEMARTVRKVNPLGLRVLVQIRKSAETSEGGLYLPEGSKDRMSESLLAQVIEVASATDIDTDEEANISGIPQGALVLIPKEAGVRVPWDESLRIIDTEDVLAMVTEVGVV